MAPPKNKTDANVMFLYICLMKSGKEVTLLQIRETWRQYGRHLGATFIFTIS